MNYLLIEIIHRGTEVISLVVIASIILSMIAQVTHARWIHHPAVRFVVAAGDAICAPFRELMQRLGLPTAPLDFSPMVALFAIRMISGFLIRILIAS